MFHTGYTLSVLAVCFLLGTQHLPQQNVSYLVHSICPGKMFHFFGTQYLLSRMFLIGYTAYVVAECFIFGKQHLFWQNVSHLVHSIFFAECFIFGTQHLFWQNVSYRVHNICLQNVLYWVHTFA